MVVVAKNRSVAKNNPRPVLPEAETAEVAATSQGCGLILDAVSGGRSCHVGVTWPEPLVFAIAGVNIISKTYCHVHPDIDIDQ